jgi:hypothetical protein
MFYLREILKKSGYSRQEIQQISDSLVFSYPTHSFVLQYDQVKQLGIKAEPDNIDIVAWKKMRSWLAKYMTQAADTHFIRYIIPKTRRTARTKRNSKLRKNKKK